MAVPRLLPKEAPQLHLPLLHKLRDIESRGANEANFPIPDERGWTALGEAVVPGAAPAHVLPWENLRLGGITNFRAENAFLERPACFQHEIFAILSLKSIIDRFSNWKCAEIRENP